MNTTKSVSVALGLLAAVATSDAKGPGVDYVSKVFHDGAYLPHVYGEFDILRRYGQGDKSVDEAGLLRRRYWDPSTQWEVLITSNPDIESRFRTIDEIRVSSIATGHQAFEMTESLRSLKLKGVAIGDLASKATGAAGSYGQTDTSRAKLGRFDVERVCGFSDGGSNICFYSRDKRVVAMAVGFGP